jgi:hypothetical protein
MQIRMFSLGYEGVVTEAKVWSAWHLYYNRATPRTDDKDMECGGRAERRHRFPRPSLLPKAAWRFASRCTPNSVAAAQAALGPYVSICG